MTLERNKKHYHDLNPSHQKMKKADHYTFGCQYFLWIQTLSSIELWPVKNSFSLPLWMWNTLVSGSNMGIVVSLSWAISGVNGLNLWSWSQCNKLKQVNAAASLLKEMLKGEIRHFNQLEDKMWHHIVLASGCTQDQALLYKTFWYQLVVNICILL